MWSQSGIHGFSSGGHRSLALMTPRSSACWGVEGIWAVTVYVSLSGHGGCLLILCFSVLWFSPIEGVGSSSFIICSSSREIVHEEEWSGVVQWEGGVHFVTGCVTAADG